MINLTLDDSLPFDCEEFDVVTMLAVLEHLEKPFEIAKEIFRVLKPGGKLVLTVPSKYSKPILELLAYLHMVDSNEIRDHKRYFNKCDIKELFESVGFIIERHKYFQFGMNNFCVLMKGYNL